MLNLAVSSQVLLETVPNDVLRLGAIRLPPPTPLLGALRSTPEGMDLQLASLEITEIY